MKWINSFGVLGLLAAVMAGCSSNPHKAEKVETKVERAQEVSGETLGVKGGNMVVQRKVEMAEEVRKLQNEVYSLEDRVYGNRKYGSKGLYGALKDCRLKLTSKELGGDGKLMWTEPLERITDKDEDLKIGIDEDDKLVGITEEFLKDRIQRFRKYRSTLQKRQDEYEEKLDICDASVKAKQHEINKVKASAAPSAETESN